MKWEVPAGTEKQVRRDASVKCIPSIIVKFIKELKEGLLLKERDLHWLSHVLEAALGPTRA